jgi:hypothetical protein
MTAKVRRYVRLSLIIKVWVSETKGELSASDLQLLLSSRNLRSVSALEARSSAFVDPAHWCLMLARSGNSEHTSHCIETCRIGMINQSGSR